MGGGSPISQLVEGADDPNVPDPTDTIIQLLQQTGAGVEQVRSQVEDLQARLDDPALIRAIKSAGRE